MEWLFVIIIIIIWKILLHVSALLQTFSEKSLYLSVPPFPLCLKEIISFLGLPGMLRGQMF